MSEPLDSESMTRSEFEKRLLELNMGSSWYDDPIHRQHHYFLEVMREYEDSPWPWVRWVAKRMHEDIIIRIAVADKLLGKP